MCVYHNVILCSQEKEENPVICNSMDGTWGHYAKWNESDKEKQMLPDLTYIWNPKTKQSKNLTDTEKGLVVARGRG